MKGAAAPAEWLLSQICQEFGCTPSAALREDGVLVMEILELRSYARTKAAIDQAEREEDMPNTPIAERVFEIVKEISEQRHVDDS